MLYRIPLRRPIILTVGIFCLASHYGLFGEIPFFAFWMSALPGHMCSAFHIHSLPSWWQHSVGLTLEGQGLVFLHRLF